jgi:hypothetical protein
LILTARAKTTCLAVHSAISLRSLSSSHPSQNITNGIQTISLARGGAAKPKILPRLYFAVEGFDAIPFA